MTFVAQISSFIGTAPLAAIIARDTTITKTDPDIALIAAFKTDPEISASGLSRGEVRRTSIGKILITFAPCDFDVDCN